MRKVLGLVAGLASAALVSGCAHHHHGLGQAGPDEFAVARQAPLVVPPDFALTPPKPGAAPTQGADPSAQALQALYGGQSQRSTSETAALQAAGEDSADPGVRSDVGDPGTDVIDKGTTTRDIIAAPQGDGQDARASVTPPAATPTP